MIMNTLLFLGDSLTDCGRSQEGGLGHGYVGMLAGSFPEGYRFVNLGLDGLTSSGALRQWRSFLKTGATPAVTSILIGINDAGLVMNTGFPEEQALAYFKNDLETIVTEAAGLGSRVILIEPFIFPRPPEYIHWEPCVSKLCAQVRDAAEKYGTCLVAPKEHFSIAASRSHYGWNHVTNDGIHLTDEGHRILASLWRDTFYAKMN
jgi:lysophospholipase L1-like esterase